MQINISISKIVGGVVGKLMCVGTYNPEDFVHQDFDIDVPTAHDDAAAPVAHDVDVHETLAHRPRECDEEMATVVSVGARQYQCVRAPAKILQIGRHKDNDIVVVDQTFPRFAMRVCLYAETDAATGTTTHRVKVKAAGYGVNDNGFMEMKLTDKATPLNGGRDFSTSNPVIMYTGAVPPMTGDNVRSVISIKGDVYSVQPPHLRRYYPNDISDVSPDTGYQCGDIYVRIEFRM